MIIETSEDCDAVRWTYDNVHWHDETIEKLIWTYEREHKEMNDIATFTEEQIKGAEQIAQTPQYGCDCIICGSVIPMFNIDAHIIPICNRCLADLGEIVMAKRERENAEDIAQERSEMGVRE